MTITDTCKCGATFSVSDNDYCIEATIHHSKWLEEHKVCRDTNEPPKPRSAEGSLSNINQPKEPRP